MIEMPGSKELNPNARVPLKCGFCTLGVHTLLLRTERLCPPRISVLKLLIPRVMVWRWGFWEVIRLRWWVFRNEMSDLGRRDTGGHSQKASMGEPGSGLSPGTKSAGTLTLDFPASRMVRHALLVCTPPARCSSQQPGRPRPLRNALGSMSDCSRDCHVGSHASLNSRGAL